MHILRANWDGSGECVDVFTVIFRNWSENRCWCKKVPYSCAGETRCRIQVHVQEGVVCRFRCNKLSYAGSGATRCRMQVQVQEGVVFRCRCNKVSYAGSGATRCRMQVQVQQGVVSKVQPGRGRTLKWNLSTKQKHVTQIPR